MWPFFMTRRLLSALPAVRKPPHDTPVSCRSRQPFRSDPVSMILPGDVLRHFTDDREAFKLQEEIPNIIKS